MATKKNREFFPEIAALKTKSVQCVAEKFARSIASGEYRILPGGVEIVRPQRVRSDAAELPAVVLPAQACFVKK